jgi:hypothetical protein
MADNQDVESFVLAELEKTRPPAWRCRLHIALIAVFGRIARIAAALIFGYLIVTWCFEKAREPLSKSFAALSPLEND